MFYGGSVGSFWFAEKGKGIMERKVHFEFDLWSVLEL